MADEKRLKECYDKGYARQKEINNTHVDPLAYFLPPFFPPGPCHEVPKDPEEAKAYKKGADDGDKWF